MCSGYEGNFIKKRAMIVNQGLPRIGKPLWMSKSANFARKYKSMMWTRYRQSKRYNNLLDIP